MRLRLLAAAAVPLALSAGLTFAASAEPRETDTQITSRSTLAIDTSSRSAVRSAYREMWRAADQRRPRWIGGSVNSCRPGRLSNGSTSSQLDAINFARRMSGLRPVALDKVAVQDAQAAAIMMTAENAVNHYPPRSWPCWTQTGYDAAGMSNLYQGVRSETNADKIESYLDDWGNINHAVGHRRWFLYPSLTAVGLGGTATANVSYLFGRPFNDSAPNPDWVSWPSAGWFPSRLDPRGRWSLSSGDDGADFADATVSVTFNGAPVEGIVVHPPESAPGKPTLVWEMPGRWPREPVGKAAVKIAGITIDGIPDRSTHYTVKFFRSR